MHRPIASRGASASTACAVAKSSACAGRPGTGTQVSSIYWNRTGKSETEWLPVWLPKIGKGPGWRSGTLSDLVLLVGTAGFEPATP
jgi:hypothetical protein